MAHVDASGRLTTAINIMIGTGLAAGLALAALLMGSSGQYGGVVALAMTLSLASDGLALSMLRAGPAPWQVSAVRLEAEGERAMASVKVAITLEQATLRQVDSLVARR